MNSKTDKTCRYSLVPLLAFLGMFTLNSMAVSPVRDFLKRNELDEALRICRQFEVLAAMDSDNYPACAWVYYRSDLFDSGENLRKKATNASSVEKQLLKAFSLMKSKKYDQAAQIISKLEREIHSGKEKLDVQELRAELYEMKDGLTKGTAGFVYNMLARDDSKRGRAQWGLARYHISRKEFTQAIKALEATAKLWPKHLASRYNLSLIYLEKNNLKKAGKWLAASYELNAADPGVLENLGNLFEKKGQTKNAVKYWKRAVAIKGDLIGAKKKIAIYYSKYIEKAVKKNNYKKALNYIQYVEGLGIDQPEILLQRGKIYRVQQDYEKAAGDLQAYISAQPENTEAHRELAICYINLKLVDEAATSLKKAISISPKDGDNRAWMAYVHESRGELPQAKKEWKKAIKYLKDPVSKGRATRKLSSIEQKIREKK